MKNDGGPGAKLISGLRIERGIRHVYVLILTCAVSSTYVADTLPFDTTWFGWARQARNIVAGLITFIICTAVAAGIEQLLAVRRRRAAKLSALNTLKMRRILREFNAAYHIRGAAVAVGNNSTVNFYALNIGSHRVVAVGRGALPLIVRNHGVFRYRIAHEFAHLASKDPGTETRVTAFYLSSFALLGISYLSATRNTLGRLWADFSSGGWNAVINSFSLIAFSIEANIALFGSILLVFILERRAASRIAEFYADAVAANISGSVVTAFRTSIPERTVTSSRLSEFFHSHPSPINRENALKELSVVYNSERIQYFIQGFLGSFVLEQMLQLLIATYSDTLQTYDQRKSALASFLKTGQLTTLSIMGICFALLWLTCFIALFRLRSWASAFSLNTGKASRLASSAMIFTCAGITFLLATSTNIQWQMNTAGWNPVKYVYYSWDHLLIHFTFAASLSAAIVAGGRAQLRHRYSMAMLSLLPAMAPAFLLYVIYWPHQY